MMNEAPVTVILLHGFASSGNSRKATFLRRKFAALPHVDFHAFDFNPTPADFEYMTVTGMINRLRQYVLDRKLDDFVLLGSSMGALVGLNYAHRFGGVRRLLLTGPLLAYYDGSRVPEPPPDPETVEMVEHYAFERAVPLRLAVDVDGLLYPEPPPPPAPTVIVHGRFDDVIPIAHSQAYAVQYPEQVTLHEVDGDHPLNSHLDFIWEQLTLLL